MAGLLSKAHNNSDSNRMTLNSACKWRACSPRRTRPAATGAGRCRSCCGWARRARRWTGRPRQLGELTPDCVVARCGRRGGGAESDSARAERCAAGRARTPGATTPFCPLLPTPAAGHGRTSTRAPFPSTSPSSTTPHSRCWTRCSPRRARRRDGGHLFTHASSLSFALSFSRRPERRRSSSSDTARGCRRALDSRQRLRDSSAQS